jgi:hypothetical protein
MGDTIVDYILPSKGTTQDAEEALAQYLTSHGYALQSEDFVFGGGSDQEVSAWAVPANSEAAPDAVAVLNEIADDYWVVGSFSACGSFDEQHMTVEVAP